jgi:hypothetical protein
MASPTFSPGSVGNLIASITLAPSKTVAAFLDLSTCVEGRVTCELVVGSTAPTAPTTFGAYPVYAPPTTLTGSVSTGATSLAVATAAGIHPGQKICLQQASGSLLGEIVSVSAISGTTLTVSATINSYSTSDDVYLITQTPTFAVTPGPTQGNFSATTDYSTTMALGPGQWVVSPSNGDATATVTAIVSVNKTPGFA